MSVLLVNYEPTSWVTDPRVEIYPDRVAAKASADLMPGRVSFVLEHPTDLLGLATAGPKAPDGSIQRLGAVGLAKIYNAFTDRPVRRFSDRTVAADRTEKLLFNKFINERQIVEEVQVTKEAFVPKFGDRVTLKADEARGIPEEHGSVLAISENGGATVEVDPLYRTGADDDGRRDVEMDELAPDPVGTVRMPAESATKSKKAIKAEMKAEKDAERAAKKAEKDAAVAAKKEEKAAAAALKKEEKAAAAAAKKAASSNGQAASTDGLSDHIRADSSRGKLVVLVDGERTLAEIGVALNLDVDTIKSRLRRLKVTKGIDVTFEDEKPRLVFPEGKTLASYMEAPAA